MGSDEKAARLCEAPPGLPSSIAHSSLLTIAGAAGTVRQRARDWRGGGAPRGRADPAPRAGAGARKRGAPQSPVPGSAGDAPGE
jgi:hypothetical protein